MANKNYLVTPDSHQGAPHITPERLATLHRGMIANNDYVLSTGRKFESEIISNNVIRIYDGALIQGGIRGEIERGDYKDVNISNGIIGMKRNYLIVCRWFIDAEDGRKTHQELVAVEGVATEDEPKDPEVNTNLIEDGAQIHDTILYRVVKEGLNIVKVETLFKILMNAEELMEMQKELNSKTDLTIEEIHVNSGYLTSGLNFSKRQSDGFIRFSSLQGWSLPYGATKICDIPSGYEPAKGKRATLYFGAEAAGFLEIRDDGVYAVTSKDLNSATVYLNCDLEYWIS